MTPTLEKFLYPDSVLREYEYWVVMLRPRQATLGAMVLAHKSDADSPAQLSSDSWAEMAEITGDIEATLQASFQAEKINYLMLMMVDPGVHYHVIPRYSGPREFLGLTFLDPGWAGVPDLRHYTSMNPGMHELLRQELRGGWVSS